jgi:hypothetical protein
MAWDLVVLVYGKRTNTVSSSASMMEHLCK